MKIKTIALGIFFLYLTSACVTTAPTWPDNIEVKEIDGVNSAVIKNIKGLQVISIPVERYDAGANYGERYSRLTQSNSQLANAEIIVPFRRFLMRYPDGFNIGVPCLDVDDPDCKPCWVLDGELDADRLLASMPEGQSGLSDLMGARQDIVRQSEALRQKGWQLAGCSGTFGLDMKVAYANSVEEAELYQCPGASPPCEQDKISCDRCCSDRANGRRECRAIPNH